MIKLLASDIDETLVDAQKNVPQRNIDAIKKAKDMGVIVTLASGRGTYELFDIPDQAGVVDEDRFVISCNGAIIMNIFTKEIVYSQSLKYDYANAILDYAYKNEQTCYIYTLDNKYGINLDRDSYAENQITVLADNNIDFLKDAIILKAIIKNKDMNYLQGLEIDIASLTNYDVEVAYSSDMFMEVNAKGVNKAVALKKVCDHYGIDLADTLAIGDNYNDVAMLEACGTSVAVANARLQVKDSADYVTKATNEEGAVAEAIEKFILNK
ncbi:Cof-type HAD-IIB family hydrolase [uncultured Anaerococcus sp.]|uniref:Cof-type HAD-IIB family hydrolase n=1 Tax=uncultured Anaerococcus sp. TaxID=293428 RepID=UPI00288A7D4C|nr:Cof-type HAD-IIB family hydrolase [uncultured Anaerococcus sp.]